MTDRRRWPWVVCVCRGWLLAVIGLVPSASGWGSETLEVHEVEAEHARYLNKTLRLTGRFESATGQTLRLVDSQIIFRLGKQATPVRSGMENVELSGLLRRDGERLTLVVEYLEPVPNEVKQFELRRNKVTVGDFGALYALSQWARQRGAWYADPALKQLAAAAYRESFAWEEEATARRRDVPRLLELAEEGRSRGLADRDVWRLRHRAIQIERTRLSPADAAAHAALAEKARSLLPGTEATHPVESPESLAGYRREPIVAYASASDELRRVFHRALWVDLVSRSIDLQSQLPDADLASLVRQCAELVPEQVALWRTLKLRVAKDRAARVEQLSRAEIVSLRDELIQLEAQDDARDLLAAWLATRRQKLDASDAEGAMQAARDYRELAGDAEQAADLYQQALRAAPRLADAEAALRELGYEKRGDLWRAAPTADARAARGENQLRRGSIEVGASEQDVLRQLRRPDRVARMLTSSGTLEQWIYEGPPVVYVYLRRNLAGGVAHVAAVRAP